MNKYIRNLIAGVVLALTTHAGELRLERLDPQPGSTTITPDRVVVALKFRAVGGVGGGILNSVRVKLSEEVGGAFVGVQLVDFAGGGTGQLVGPVVPFSLQSAWVNVGLVLPQGASYPMGIALVSQGDIRLFSRMTATLTLDGANTGRDNLVLSPIAGNAHPILDERITLDIRSEGLNVIVTGRGERNTRYALQESSNLVNWHTPTGTTTTSDAIGTVVWTVPRNATFRAFFRAIKVP